MSQKLTFFYTIRNRFTIVKIAVLKFDMDLICRFAANAHIVKFSLNKVFLS